MKTIPDIPIIFEGRVSEDYINDVEGWAFQEDYIETNSGKLLTLDIDFGEHCSLNCPWCFRKNGYVDASKNAILSYDEVIDMLYQAKKLGLKTVKFLGAGEPFENSKLLQFLRELKKMEIKASIFTKGHVLGDDALVKKYFEYEGIETAKALIDEMVKLEVSVLLSFQSFDTEFQDSLVKVDGYTLKRNRALELLVKAGLNKHNPTRLALICLPVTKSTITEVFEIYQWGRERNMYVVACPSMCSGRATEECWRSITPSDDELINLYTRIYKYNIKKGIQTLEQIREEGISPYAGGAPCNQVACGMYITSRGIVLRCPGDDVTIFGDIRKNSLEDMWYRSENYRRKGTFNCKCPPKDGKSIPLNLYDKVLASLE